MEIAKNCRAENTLVGAVSARQLLLLLVKRQLVDNLFRYCFRKFQFSAKINTRLVYFFCRQVWLIFHTKPQNRNKLTLFSNLGIITIEEKWCMV